MQLGIRSEIVELVSSLVQCSSVSTCVRNTHRVTLSNSVGVLDVQ